MSAPRRKSASGDVVEAASPDKVEQHGRRPARAKVAEPERKNLLAVRGERAKTLYQDTLSEMKKITWPDQETTRNLTIVVIGISVAMGALLGSIDYLLVQLLGLF